MGAKLAGSAGALLKEKFHKLMTMGREMLILSIGAFITE
jgi:hypothetical protein